MDGLDALVVVPQGIELAPLIRALERLGYPGSSASAGRLECVVMVIRAITDGADGAAAADFRSNLERAMPNLARVLALSRMRV